ncbi:hypothetical protein BDV96DRAFT_287697 [Lophiotrema nucula]|uniref:Uncharacterized protein n=1 Tax=Lophiotrema nucula TaxID=690887 RepID=A0A6A5YN23_9PLEO|nr:hypothetical protein BDV96DRAFT_287697 [Lophiotrema nucula]
MRIRVIVVAWAYFELWRYRTRERRHSIIHAEWIHNTALKDGGSIEVGTLGHDLWKIPKHHRLDNDITEAADQYLHLKTSGFSNGGSTSNPSIVSTNCATTQSCRRRQDPLLHHRTISTFQHPSLRNHQTSIDLSNPGIFYMADDALRRGPMAGCLIERLRTLPGLAGPRACGCRTFF